MRTAWRMTQSDANRSPPQNSLLNREITGNFLDLDLNHADRASKKPRFAEGFLGEFPTRWNREILKAEQRISLAHQVIFRADWELISYR